MEKKEVVNLGNLDYHIKEVEKKLQEEGLDIVEQALVLKTILVRIEAKKKKVEMQDLISGASIGGLVKRTMGFMTGEKKEE